MFPQNSVDSDKNHVRAFVAITCFEELFEEFLVSKIFLFVITSFRANTASVTIRNIKENEISVLFS